MIVQIVTLNNEILLASSFIKDKLEYDCEFKEETQKNRSYMVAYPKFNYLIVNEENEILFTCKNKDIRDAVLNSIVSDVLFEYSVGNNNPIIDLRNIYEDINSKKEKD